MGLVALAQGERGGEVWFEVWGGLDGCEEGLVDGLLVGNAGFWEGLLLLMRKIAS